MSLAFIKPDYVYDEKTTLKSSLAAFLAANQDRRAAAAQFLRVKVETFTQWIDGTWTDGLLTKCFNGFVEMTGIDLDRLMVIEAKRRIWERDPSMRRIVTFERFQTRQDVVAEILRLKDLPSYGGTRFIAWQITEIPNGELFSQWSLGRTKPDGDNLEMCLIGLSRGLVETGTHNDLALRMSIRRVCGMDPEECLGLSTFAELVNAVFTRELKARGATIAAQQTGMNVTTVADLIKWTPDSVKVYPYGTIFNLVRCYVRTRWDATSQEGFARVTAEFLDPSNKAYAVKAPVLPQRIDTSPSVPMSARTEVPREAAVPREATADPEPSRAQPTRGSEPTTLDEGVRRLATHLRTQLLQAAVDFPDVVRRLPLIPGLEIGETLHNVRWCLTGTSVPDAGAWNPSDQEIELVAEAIALLRRTLMITLGLPMPVRRRVITRLAPELDELFLAFDHAGVEDLAGFAEQITLQRQQAGIVRKGRR